MKTSPAPFIHAFSSLALLVGSQVIFSAPAYTQTVIHPFSLMDKDWNFKTFPGDMYSIPLGNVGIGTDATTPPREKLQLVGTMLIGGSIGGPIYAGTVPRLQADAAGGARILGIQGETPAQPAIGFFSTDGVNDGGGGLGIYRPLANTMAFSTASTERMRLTSGGALGIGTSSPTAALHVVGNVVITGNLSKGSGSFRIDHPLDPANKYLSHSFVESPDMMNVYNGNVTLDTNGTAWVEMPDWFGVLNSEFRYQLTAIGAPGPNLYVAEEVTGNRFKIAGGAAAAKVSWQVTGIRQDAFANANRIRVEELKPAEERGTYLHPELYSKVVQAEKK